MGNTEGFVMGKVALSEGVVVDPNESGVKPAVGLGQAVFALAAALAFVYLTRWPVLRPGPFESDEQIFLEVIRRYEMPMHYTLFLASARLVGIWVGDPYRGFLFLDMTVSALALVSVWWWLRAVVRPGTALAAALALGVAPLFWAYGAMAGNYTAIPLVGSFLLGVAVRSLTDPKPWHPFAAAALFALGTGYRQDIGVFWMPVFLAVLWRQRRAPALLAMALYVALNLAWFRAMLHDVGGWARYRTASREFATQAGYLNSVWNLGLVDAPLRYAVKLGAALLWTFGPALAFAPRGAVRLASGRQGPYLTALLALSVLPALLFHLLIHFGVPGYALHYVPALTALVALGIGKLAPRRHPGGDRSAGRLLAVAGSLATVFWFYPTDYDRPGLRGEFDLSFARHTRAGLKTCPPLRAPSVWRTANSRPARPGGPTKVVRAGGPDLL
jgi:hypothetical protein